MVCNRSPETPKGGGGEKKLGDPPEAPMVGLGVTLWEILNKFNISDNYYLVEIICFY